jgi:thiol-disulfide isomerase/thioredoxin
LEREQTIYDLIRFLTHFSYAPWCGHCKRLAPTWAELATKAQSENLSFKVGKVDCTTADNKDLCTKFGVRGYPTVKL